MNDLLVQFDKIRDEMSMFVYFISTRDLLFQLPSHFFSISVQNNLRKWSENNKNEQDKKRSLEEEGEGYGKGEGTITRKKK